MWSRAFINKNSNRNKGLYVDRGLEKSFLCKFAFSHLTWADGCLFCFFVSVFLCIIIFQHGLHPMKGVGVFCDLRQVSLSKSFFKSWKLKSSVKSPLKFFLRNWQGANVDELWGTCFVFVWRMTRAGTPYALFFFFKLSEKCKTFSISTNWGYHLLFSFCNSWF